VGAAGFVMVKSYSSLYSCQHVSWQYSWASLFVFSGEWADPEREK